VPGLEEKILANFFCDASISLDLNKAIPSNGQLLNFSKNLTESCLEKCCKNFSISEVLSKIIGILYKAQWIMSSSKLFILY
jgi:hypothetical protein